jgi:superfamily I DNA/RNA helicase
MTRGSLPIKPWTHRHLRLSDPASVDRRCKELIERVQKHKILQTLDEADEACRAYNDKLRLSGLLDMADLHIHVFTASFPTSGMWRYSVTPSSVPKQLTKGGSPHLQVIQSLRAENGAFFRQLLYTHVFVDEFQDANDQQLELVRLLSKGFDGYVGVTVIGDDDQSIYGFR